MVKGWEPKNKFRVNGEEKEGKKKEKGNNVEELKKKSGITRSQVMREVWERANCIE